MIISTREKNELRRIRRTFLFFSTGEVVASSGPEDEGEAVDSDGSGRVANKNVGGEEDGEIMTIGSRWEASRGEKQRTKGEPGVPGELLEDGEWVREEVVDDDEEGEGSGEDKERR